MESNFGNTIACMPQFWDWLQQRKDEDKEVSGRVWEAVEIRTRKSRIAKAKRRKERKKKKKNKKIKKEKYNGCKKYSKRIGDLRERGEAVKLEKEVKKLVSLRFYN